ncbi:MAG TPA: O-acetyl-ADP-ribose deacetylase [Bacteroidales bacterium]|nr:O-acetyl-ADP-ribose deacetylase [Bacteroidales bacterium]
MKKRIEIIKGDITKVNVDAIVNAANSSLMGGGGVDGAIHRVGGKTILDECKEIIKKQGRCNTGEAVITNAGNLPAKFVIHTVGPIWNDYVTLEQKEKFKIQLANCYTNALKLAIAHDCKTIAFPNISTGVYKFPKEEAAIIAIKTVKEFLKNNNRLQKVIFVCYDEENYNIYLSHVSEI